MLRAWRSFHVRIGACNEKTCGSSGDAQTDIHDGLRHFDWVVNELRPHRPGERWCDTR